MDIFVPFAEYPCRIYKFPTPLTIAPIELEFIQDYKQRYKKRINVSTLTVVQKIFFFSLVQLKGVSKVSCSVNVVTICKTPGYEWDYLEPKLVELITSCPITKEDLDMQIQLYIAHQKKNLR